MTNKNSRTLLIYGVLSSLKLLNLKVPHCTGSPLKSLAESTAILSSSIWNFPRSPKALSAVRDFVRSL